MPLTVKRFSSRSIRACESTLTTQAVAATDDASKTAGEGRSHTRIDGSGRPGVPGKTLICDGHTSSPRYRWLLDLEVPVQHDEIRRPSLGDSAGPLQPEGLCRGRRADSAGVREAYPISVVSFANARSIVNTLPASVPSSR